MKNPGIAPGVFLLNSDRSLRAMAFSWPNLDFRGKSIIRSAEDGERIPLVIQPNLTGVDSGKARRREARPNA